MNTDVLTENGPVVLVPAAWTVAGAAHAGRVETETLLIAHVVMATLIAVFAAVSWSEMSEGVLRVWRAVLVAGFFVTLSGVVGLSASPSGSIPAAVSLYGWFGLPAAGFVYTAREVDAGAPYAAGALLCAAGAAVYVTAPVAGVAVVGAGQTVGIADAAYRY